MLEMQISVRERTAALGTGVKEGSRQALSAVTALAKREEKITAMGKELINIVEETEFGIALPAALAAVRDATEAVQFSLADGDASAEVVAAEKQIEADLKAMIDVVSEMSDANSRKGRRGGNSPEDQRKEQNRIISELKMIRLLEERVHAKHRRRGNEAGRRPTFSTNPQADRRSRRPPGRHSRRHRATWPPSAATKSPNPNSLSDHRNLRSQIEGDESCPEHFPPVTGLALGLLLALPIALAVLVWLAASASARKTKVFRRSTA